MEHELYIIGSVSLDYVGFTPPCGVTNVTGQCGCVNVTNMSGPSSATPQGSWAIGAGDGGQPPPPKIRGKYFLAIIM